MSVYFCTSAFPFSLLSQNYAFSSKEIVNVQYLCAFFQYFLEVELRRSRMNLILMILLL